MLRSRFVILAVLLCSTACAEGGSGGVDSGARSDSGGMRGDGSPDDVDAARTDGGRRDSGSSTSCGTGEHACGGGCIDDLANMPENGCRLGCGEPCPAPTSGTVSCSAAGTCDFACTPPFRRAGDECVCTPRTCDDMGAMCGAPDDGCGAPLDCGSCGSGSCIDGRCACDPDAREENDSNTTATMLGSFSDDPDPADGVYATFNIDEMADVDWFRFAITDGTDGGNPRMTVTLDQIPMGANYDLSAFYVCAGGTDASTCDAGSADNEIGHGCTSATAGTAAETVEIASECEHLSTDDGGTLYVRVRAASWASSCGPYRITLRVR